MKLIFEELPAWAFMWILAFAIYAICKWVTWQTAPERHGSGWRSVAYLLAWPGMDARAFLSRGAEHARPAPTAWAVAVFITALGATMLWRVTRLAPDNNPALAGWIGLLGLVLLLHFGLFHLIALIWQHLDINAQSIMRSPIRATSLADFWSKRWNVAFHQLAEHLVFQPVRRRAGVAVAMVATFAASGLIHDLVISVPAGAGYGLPTAYFVCQGIGVLVQRSRPARRARLNTGVYGWLFTALFTAGPAYWLFHPPFIHRVIVPFLRAIGAL